ncbi:hypothetical protein ABH927_000950 [Planotetraspora sp. GP83]
MVVVVAHTCLVPGGASRRFDAAEEPPTLESAQGVIYGLQGHLADPFTDTAVYGVHIEVFALPYGLHDCQPGRGHPQACLAKSDGVSHVPQASIKPERFK